MGTRKSNQIDLQVNNVQDLVVKEALVQIADFINTMVGVGIVTDGSVKAIKGFNAGDKTFKAMLFSGTLGNVGSTDPANQRLLVVPGKIIGATGHAQFNGTSEWRVMNRGSTTTSVYFKNGDGAIDRVMITNSDATNDNVYRVIIFYTETDQ